MDLTFGLKIGFSNLWSIFWVWTTKIRSEGDAMFVPLHFSYLGLGPLHKLLGPEMLLLPNRSLDCGVSLVLDASVN